MKVTHAFAHASGLDDEHCHCVGYRHEGDDFQPDRGESWVVRIDPGVISAGYGKVGWYTGLWRSLEGAVFVSDVTGRLYVNLTPEPMPDPPWQNFDVGGVVEGVWGLDAQHVFAWGRKGGAPRVLRYEGDGWSELPSPPGFVVAMHGVAPDAVFAVGEDGLIARWDGERWLRMESDTTYTLSGVFVADRSHVWVCGVRGDLLEGSVHGFQRVMRSSEALLSIAWWRDRVWVGTSGERGLCLLEGDALVSVKPNLRPSAIDARGALLLSCRDRVSCSTDGVSYMGSRVAGFQNLLTATEPPRWATRGRP